MTKQMQNETEKESITGRRKILKMGGVTVASLVGASTAGSVSAQSNNEPDTDFDPERREKAVAFLNDVDGFSEEQQQEYATELDSKQKQAIVDLYDEVEWEYSTYRMNHGDGLQPASTYEPQSERTIAEGNVGGVGTVYKHIQILTWESSGGDYRNASQELDHKLPGPFATFNGKTEDEIERSTTSFTATLSAEYEAEVLGFTRGGEATIESQGDEDGNFEVLSRDAPTS